MTLALDSVSKQFGALRVLREVSLAFEPGTVTSLVGDNGAGKSTLLKLLAGVHRPDAGRIVLEGRSIPDGAARGAGIEMVFQDLALAKSHDVPANLYLGRELTRWGILRRREMRNTSAKLLADLGVNIPRIDVPVGTLSGGQQQAIAIARALLFDPKVLLLDEPTAALAAREVERVLALLRAEKDRGRIVVLVSHRLNDVFAVSDRIVVLKQGRVVSDAPAASQTLSEVVELIVS